MSQFNDQEGMPNRWEAVSSVPHTCKDGAIGFRVGTGGGSVTITTAEGVSVSIPAMQDAEYFPCLGLASIDSVVTVVAAEIRVAYK